MQHTVITVSDMRRMEETAAQNGFSYDAMMERAGKAVVTEILSRYDKDRLAHILVVCGSGNNGGDGYVIAARLCELTDCHVTVLAVSAPISPLAIKKAAALDKTRAAVVRSLADVEKESVTLVVDAVYGFGFHGRFRRPQRELFVQLAAWQLPVVAVDIPSGIDADSGLYDPDTLKADLTVTFTAKKPAACVPTAAALHGDIVVASIGIDEEIISKFSTAFCVIDKDMVRARMLLRPANGHKGTFGRLLSVCGSYGMAGAAMLSGKAALRCGVGLLDMALVRSIYPIVAGQLWEAVYHPLCETADGHISMAALPQLETLLPTCDAVLIGCGLSVGDETAALLKAWLPTVVKPVVIDADGLNIMAAHRIELKATASPRVITPHPAEAARLLGVSTSQIEADRPTAAKQLAKAYGAVVVLKGHRTLVTSPDGMLFVNTSGNSGMATGGSGDVLGGMIAAFLANGMEPLAAAVCGVHLHGLAGDAAAAVHGETAMLPTDMLDMLGTVLSHFEIRE